MKTLCIIPARGGSKRIPRKNIKPFLGKPIIAYSIEAAISSNLFDEVIVSTDDEEIAKVAKSYGASVPFLRPAELSNDYVGTIDVVAHAICYMEDKYGSFKSVCCLYATAPFVRIIDLKKSSKILENGYSYVLPATEFSSPIFRSFRRRSDNCIDMFFPEHFSSRSQDLETAFHDAGQFYWGSSEAWKRGEQLFSENTYMIEIPRRYVQDIDTDEDWIIAEYMYKALQETNG